MSVFFMVLLGVYSVFIAYIVNAIGIGQMSTAMSIAASCVIFALFATLIVIATSAFEHNRYLKEENFKLKRELIRSKKHNDENSL